MKNLSNKINKWIIEHSIFKFLITIFIFLVFHKQFENIFDKSLVNTILNKIESNTFNDILFILFTTLYILFKINNRKQYKDKIQLVIINLGLTLCYSYYRFLSNDWCFTSFNIFYRINYSDLFYLIFLSNLINAFNFKLTDKVNKGFIENEPIDSIENDLLGYSIYASQIANQIKNTYHNKSFAIGINGSWGTGKTSFINLLIKNLNNEYITIIEFNAWNSNSTSSIIQDFFETLNDSLKVYNSSISKLLYNYSKKLVGLHENETTKLLNNYLLLLTNENSTASLYKEIEAIIERIDKKIVIIIDDLDRLDKEEIIEVIRLIRNTANFKNVMFVVAYDREYIIKALDKHNPYKSERFLDKIIQLELTLPYFIKDIYRERLAKLIKDKVNIESITEVNRKVNDAVVNDFYTEIDDTLLARNIAPSYYIYNWVENQRDVIKLANALILNINYLFGEIVFADFLRIELLRFKYPSVYLLFFSNLDKFLENVHDNNKNRYQLKRDDNNSKAFVINKYLDEIDGLNKIEKEKIVSLLEGIFYEKGKFILGELRPSSIVFPSNINRYIAYKLLEGSLSQIEFSNARLLKLDKFQNKINEWLDSKLEFEIKQKFIEIKDFNNREDFENVIQVIFYLANQKTKINTYPFNIISFDFEYLFDILIYNSEKNIKKYYSLSSGNQDYKHFIFGLFKNAKSPYYFESELLVSWNKDKFTIYDTDEYIISKEELNELSIEYLQKYEESINVLNDDFVKLFYRTRNTNRVEVNGRYNESPIFPDKSIQIFKSLINKDLNSFLNWSVINDTINNERFTIRKDIIEVLFETFGAYEIFLNEKNDDKNLVLKEYLHFFKVVKENHYNGHTNFEFFNIKPTHLYKN